MKSEDERDLVQSLSRGLDVILAFSGDSPRLTLSEVAVRTGLSRATARRLLLTLQARGFAASDGRHFSLTPRVLSLGHAYLSSLDLTEIAQGHMEAVAQATGEGCTLAALDSPDVVYITRVSTHRIPGLILTAGTRLPAHATSLGHALLADLREHELDSYLEEAELFAMTGRTVRTPEVLRERLALVREQGWALVDQELEEGLRSISAPVRDAEGRTIAAIGLSAATTTADLAQLQARYLPPLLEAAAAISTQLGASHERTSR